MSTQQTPPVASSRKSNLRVVQNHIEMPMPHSVEAEEAVLGSLLIDRDVVSLVAPHLKSEYFFSEERANIYQAVLNLYSDRVPADMVTVRQELKTMGALGEGEGQVKPAYLLQLMRTASTPVHVEYYQKIVIRHWLARQIIGECSQTVGQAFKGALPSGELLAQHTDRLQSLVAGMTTPNPDYVLSHEKTLDYPFQFDRGESNGGEGDDPWGAVGGKAKSAAPSLRFGWDAFDGRDWAEPPNLCLLPATLTTILARTGGGKTIAAMQIADANAKAGLNVLYFHVELNQQQMLARRYCRLTGVPVLAQILRRNLSDRELELLVKAAGEISEWPGRVDFVHCPNWSAVKLVQELKARHYALLASTGSGYDLIVLDYLQRLGRPEGRGGMSEHEALAANVRAFSDVANELNIAALMTSQVGRNESQQYEPPEISEGLGSGDIERCSNQLLSLAISEAKDCVQYAIRKNTFGQQGQTGEMTYDAKRLQFL